VEVMLDPAFGVVSPPLPFELGGDKTSWLLQRSEFQAAALRKDPAVSGHDAPLPSLVTLGRDEAGIFMLNIERAGSVALSGDEADSMIQGVAIELATASWADQIDLVLVGFGDHEERLERVSYGRSLRAVEARLERRIRERKTLLELAHRASNPTTRWLDEIDPWDICVVVCAADVAVREIEAAQSIVRLAGDGSFGVAFVCGCDLVEARWRVHTEGGRVSVDRRDGETLSPLSAQQVPPNLVENVTSLVSVAAKTGGVEPANGPYEGLALPIPERPAEISESRAGTSGEEGSGPPDDHIGVTVNVLGPVEIIGAARPFARAWTTELVVYLVMHPGGANNEQWATALWPERAMAPASLHSTASAARRSLGSDAEGEDHLPRSRGRLAVGHSVHSDWDVLVVRSRSSDPAEWRQALGLIRGRPFEGMRSPDWVLLEGIQATIEAVVVDLACRSSEDCLASFDAAGAEWAARQGLRVSPYDERLYRVLMRCADAAGNPAGVEAIMAELVHLVADDVEPFDAVHPETLALYQSLSRRSMSSRARLN
ncbi:MAG: bacterial transcriptional activator domain-containing protein, partial [Nitrososphaerales archaeon]